MKYIKHRVIRGETIVSIANKYGTSVRLIVFLNRNSYNSLIDNPYIIFEGWKLTVPLIMTGGDVNPEPEE